MSYSYATRTSCYEYVNVISPNYLSDIKSEDLLDSQISWNDNYMSCVEMHFKGRESIYLNNENVNYKNVKSTSTITQKSFTMHQHPNNDMTYRMLIEGCKSFLLLIVIELLT